MLLGEILIEAGAVCEEDVEAALAQQRMEGNVRRLGDILIQTGQIKELALLRALSVQYHLDLVEEPPAYWLDPALVEELPVEWARAHTMLPVRSENEILALTADPPASNEMDYLYLVLKKDLTPICCPTDAIRQAIEACYFSRSGASEQLIRTMDKDDGTTVIASNQTAANDLLITQDAPLVQLVNSILLDAVKAEASDIHIEPYEDRLQVRYRLDGRLYAQTSPPKRYEAEFVSRLKYMARLNMAEKRMPQDGMARVRVGEREIDIRVSTMPVAEGERVVLRLLNKQSALMPLSDLGMSAALLDQFRLVLNEPQGIVLVTGPTGSGKTTTLYAALQELDTRHINVMTIEDPIEYQLSHISQIQVKPDIELTFAHGLRHILRQDPDVILVGETRDLETAEIAVRASLTGHLVFSTLHTNDAPSALVRMADMGIASYLLCAALKAVMAQRLVRVLCPHCRQPALFAPGSGSVTGRDLTGGQHWCANGCDQCLDGFRGRTGIYELMLVTSELQETIRQGVHLDALRNGVAAELTLARDGIDKVLAGVTSFAEVERILGRLALRAS